MLSLCVNVQVSRSGVNCTQSASSIEVYVILGIQGICVLGCVILAIVVFVQKSTPVSCCSFSPTSSLIFHCL